MGNTSHSRHQRRFRWLVITAVFAILASGCTTFTWGNNDLGQLGNGSSGTDVDEVTAIGPQPQHDWHSVAGGGAHTCGLRSTNTLWCWGDNDLGQLGDNTTTDRPNRIQVGATTDWTDIDAGSLHTCGLRGQFGFCWGRNTNGRLGDGTTTQRNTPTAISPASGWADIATGERHSCATRTNGTLRCWGWNTNGQLGDGTQTDRLLPTQIGTDTDWASIDLGQRHTCATKANGTLWCWGQAFFGQAGNPGINILTPTQVGADTNWNQVSTGDRHTCATKTTGTLWCFGLNTSGQLGDGTTTNHTPPAQVGTNTDWTSVSTGASHTCGTRTANLHCWGSNTLGQLGDGTTTNKLAPTEIATSNAWTLATVGNEHSCAFQNKLGTRLWCWGNNNNGQLGDGSTADRQLPTPIEADYSAVTVGEIHSCHIRVDSALFCWGNNGFGELGIGSFGGTVNSPTQVGTQQWTSVSGGFQYSTCAIRTNGTLWCWGNNSTGQLGDGTTINRNTPTQVGLDNDWATIAAGRHTCAVRTDTSLWCWGSNFAGQLGNGTTTDSSTPALIGTGFVDVATGERHTCATKTTGTLWCWGGDLSGQLGTGAANQPTTVPVQVGTDTNWSDIDTSYRHNCATRTDTTLWCWGANGFGQTAGTNQVGTFQVPTPQQVGAVGWNTPAAGGGHTCAIKSVAGPNQLWCWGDNTDGQLGLGFSGSTNQPPTQTGFGRNWLLLDAGQFHTIGADL